MKRTKVGLILPLIVLALFAPAAWSGDSLNFFNNWFVTGDYAVGGVGLRGTGVNGFATGTIHVSGLPSGAQPIAAFLYWSTVEPIGAPGAAIGYFNGNKIQGAALGNPQSPNPACASSGGGTTGMGMVYRADVLRYIPVDSNNIAQASGPQTVKLPDAGPGGNGIITNGASLIVIYKIVVPGLPTLVPLRAVVIYNGAFTMNKLSAGFTQNVAGFYQASSVAAARITAIAANGQSNFTSPLSVNGKSLDTDPFVGAQGGRWDNPSYGISLSGNASSFSTLATVSGSQTCVTWAAMVASTNVQDSDNDGLLDIWETKGLHRNTQVSPATFGGCSDYPADPCVNLPAMGASVNKKDVFIQLDWMHGHGDGTGGIDGAGTHDHIPQLAALNAVASTFANHSITLHFDVGNNYQGAQATCGKAPCSFIVPATYAQGGSDIDESTLVCRDTPNHPCDYHEPYPILSFEFGFASVRDGNHLLNINSHFAQIRRDVFHYALFAHALAGPFDANGNPIDPFTLQPTTTPLSYSGIAHRPGGGFMVTLGLWRSDIPANDQVGSALVQQGTLMHELGHNLGLGHAGLATTPNCMPNYPSAMNYMYQTRGLTDSSGNEQIDYSNGVLLPMAENFLSSAIPMGLLPGLQKYRVRYYGPLAPNQPSTQAATAHCDGTPVKGGEAFEVRLEGSAISTPDWSNGTVPLGHILPPTDVNYDGNTGQVFLDQPDWLTLNLQQIGTGYSFGGLSVGSFSTNGGAFAVDAGALAVDAGALAVDAGAFAVDAGAFAVDAGAFAVDGGAFAVDGGALSTDGGALAVDAGELSESTLLASSIDSPTGVTATPTISSIQLNWIPPSVGNVTSYTIYRCAGAGCTTASAPAFRSISGGSPTPSFNDVVNDFVHAGATCPSTSTCYNTTYVYAVTDSTLVNSKTIESLQSKPPVGGEVTHLFVLGNSQNVVYGAAIAPASSTIYGDVAGSLAGVSCAFLPANPRNVGTYSVVCSGPASSSPTDGVTYNAAYLTNTPGVLTITQRPITVAAAASSKVYDGAVSSPVTPAVTSGTLAYSDTLNFVETYDNRNVGTTHVLTPSGTVNDGNAGNNYNVTFVNANGGIITVRPVTVTANASMKVYDGGIASTSVPILSGGLGSGDSATFTETYDNKNVGTTHTMTAAGSISDGNAGNNYSIVFASIATGIITQAPASVTPNPASKTYGASDPVFTGTLAGFLAADGVTATYSRTPGETVALSPYTISATLSATGLLSNYAITSNTANFVINRAPASVTPNANGKTYGMPDPSPLTTGTLAGFLPADNVTATYSRAAGTDVGMYLISATLAPAGVLGNYSIVYNPANFTISPAPQTIAFAPLSDQSFGAVDFNATASASSGLPVSFTATGNCSVTTAGLVHLISTGTCNITASQAGGLDFLAAPSVMQPFNITAIDFTKLVPMGSPSGVIPTATATTLTMSTAVSQTSAAWLPARQPLANGFTTQFNFQISPAGGQIADGFAFVIQNSGDGTGALGATGMGGFLGYQGISSSLAIEFDTYQNGWDPNANHVAAQSNGTGPNTADHTAHIALHDVNPNILTNLSDGNVHLVTITYDGATLLVFLDGNQVLSETINLGTLGVVDGSGNAVIGFTAATGAASELTRISGWSFTPNQ